MSFFQRSEDGVTWAECWLFVVKAILRFAISLRNCKQIGTHSANLFEVHLLGKCNEQCFKLYCCLSGPKFPPLFPWSSNTMCCNFIIYILSLVRRRGREIKKRNDSPILAVETPTVPGNCSWDEQNDCWNSRKAPGEWRRWARCARRRQKQTP